MKVITLQRDAICAGCGKDLPAGTIARYYSPDRIYCETHQDEQEQAQNAGSKPPYQGAKQPPQRGTQSRPWASQVTAQDIKDLTAALEQNTAATQWNTEQVNACRDLLATTNMLIRMKGGDANDQKDALNFKDAKPIESAAKKVARTHKVT